MHDFLKEMTENREKAHQSESVRTCAAVCCSEVRRRMDALRECADDLELICDDRSWSLVKYREMMFIR